ncbi:MAG: radical SAM protein [Patescibacteria group bacterium]|nr:radical SAM protein [Patescibacteria group bacterium]
MTQVLLINCPITFSRKNEPMGDEVSDPPLGLLYIAAYLEKHNISVKLYDVTVQGLTLKKLMQEIEKENPKVVGLSALSPSIRSAYRLASEMKKEWGNHGPMVGLGGPHISADPDFARRFPIFDFYVIGEGELTMLKIVQKVLAGKRVKGVFYAEPIQNLDDLPFPARHLTDVSNYHRGVETKLTNDAAAIYKRASMIGSRGCPFHCCFCSRPVHKTNYRFRSAENIIKEMETIYNQYNGKFHFHDDTFSLNRENIKNFCQLLIKKGLNATWGAMTRANSVNEELIKLMAKAGCNNLLFGVESGNERIRNEVIHKNVNNRDIFNAIRWCRKYGIQSNIFLMLGFPGETKKEIKDTVNFGLISKVDVMGIHITVIMPGADLYKTGVEEGKININLIDRYIRGELGDEFKSIWPKYIPRDLTLEDLVKAKKQAYRRFYLNPEWILRRIWWDLSNFDFLREDARLLKAAFQAITQGGTKSAMS